MPATYLALLRGINVGGKNRLAMPDLVTLFGDAGCHDVRTYIQSGNVVFAADPAGVPSLPDSIAALITERYGLQVPVVLRTTDQLREVVRHNPFLAAGAPADTLHVQFLATAPNAMAVAALDPDRSPPDTFSVRGQDIYLRLPNGVARTKLGTAYFDAKLATISTGRNWRTVMALLALMEHV